MSDISVSGGTFSSLSYEEMVTGVLYYIDGEKYTEEEIYYVMYS